MKNESLKNLEKEDISMDLTQRERKAIKIREDVPDGDVDLSRPDVREMISQRKDYVPEKRQSVRGFVISGDKQCQRIVHPLRSELNCDLVHNEKSRKSSKSNKSRSQKSASLKNSKSQKSTSIKIAPTQLNHFEQPKSQGMPVVSRSKSNSKKQKKKKILGVFSRRNRV
ncbi:unnamed protein product [Caenorhabditis angaria]|uniref:Uncharacterized protein n=1 Tax=Caenorhabditis angaria TaxID=860376 RepID=A0A9P1J180_9PELO|nr:unnamed protein product [Caenorhabditis angaria]